MLICPVRNCRLPLERDAGRVFCATGHSFDIARSGYINLLQPQERRSKQPGDAKAAVTARRRLHDLGVTKPLLAGIAAFLAPISNEVVLDAGCGDGFYLGELAERAGCDAHGVDISTPAIEAAAKRYPGCEWIVGNADRSIPYSDEAFSIVLSITGRMNPKEFRRVLRRRGRLLVALAAPDDLIELRGAGRDRIDRTLETFTGQFKLLDRRRVTTATELEAFDVANVLRSIYRPLQKKPPQAMRVTFSLDLLVFCAK